MRAEFLKQFWETGGPWTQSDFIGGPPHVADAHMLVRKVAMQKGLEISMNPHAFRNRVPCKNNANLFR